MKRDYILVNYIPEARASLGMSQSALARKIGISRYALSLIELGKMGCSAYVAARLCYVLNTSFKDLFFLAPRR